VVERAILTPTQPPRHFCCIRPIHAGTLLHYACRKARRKAIAFLFEAGADVNGVDGDGETPLFWLATIARIDAHTVEMLEAMVMVLGADVDHRCYLGRVALHYAVVRGAVDQVRRRRIEALLKLGADPRLRDWDGKAPVDYLGQRTDGGTWTDALPENEREMRRCRELLQVGEGSSCVWFVWGMLLVGLVWSSD
jgi:ankyrin repeat protein